VGVISKLEGGLDNAFDRAAGAVFRGPLEPAQIAKRAEKQMYHEKLVGAGKQHAPTLYTVLVNPSDDRKLFAFYPTIAAEIETYLTAKGTQRGLKFDGRPLVRFIVDKDLKSGKFDVIAENVSAPTIAKLRQEEMEYYGIEEKKPRVSLREEPRDRVSPHVEPRDRVSPHVEPRDRVSPHVEPEVRTSLPNYKLGEPGREASLPNNARARVSLPHLEGHPHPGLVSQPEQASQSGRAYQPEQASQPGRACHPEQASQPGRAYQPEQASQPGQATQFRQARLTDMSAAKSYKLTKSPTILGREVSCDIVITDANISRQHAKFTQDAVGTWKITDLNSTNGSKLNGRPVTSALLRDGDQISVGITVLEFREF